MRSSFGAKIVSPAVPRHVPLMLANHDPDHKYDAMPFDPSLEEGEKEIDALNGDDYDGDDLGLRFSSEDDRDKENISTAPPAERAATVVPTRTTQKRPLKTTAKAKALPSNDQDLHASVNRLISETRPMLSAVVKKPKSFSTLLHGSRSLTTRSPGSSPFLRQSQQAEQLEHIKRHISQEQFELLKKAPRLSADDQVSSSGLTVLPRKR